MRNQKKRPLRLGRSAIIGIRLGVFAVGVMAAVTLAVIGFQTYQARTGGPGGEILILPAYLLLFYCGWTARGDTERYRRSKRKEARPYAMREPFSTSGSKS